MTGTGTQIDPYIVDNWNDFIAAIGEENVYVKIVDNIIWNMDEILPNGLDSQISVKCKEIDGNFAEIKNLRISDDHFFYFYFPVEIYRLKLLNITEMTNDNDRSWFYASGGSSNKGQVYFKNCTITGIMMNGYFATGSSYLPIYFTNDETNGCSINIRFEGNSHLSNSGSYTNYLNSLIELGGNSSYANETFSHFENCYIQGECPWNEMTITAKAANIFDIKINTLSSGSSSTSTYKQNVVNIDKVTTQEESTKYLTLVTEEQLHDVEYLKSVGFPIL